MAFRIEGDRLTVKSRHAWAMWLLYGIFALGFPPAILAMWQAGPEKIPLLANLAFTGLFLAGLPFLLGEIAKQRLVTAHLDRKTGVLEVSQRGLITHSRETRRIEDVDRVEMETSDNDGEFHALYVVFRDGSRFAFSHGNYRRGMEEERDRFLAFLRMRRPELQAVEKFV